MKVFEFLHFYKDRETKKDVASVLEIDFAPALVEAGKIKPAKFFLSVRKNADKLATFTLSLEEAAAFAVVLDRQVREQLELLPEAYKERFEQFKSKGK